jgi:hypothetical protein
MNQTQRRAEAFAATVSAETWAWLRSAKRGLTLADLARLTGRHQCDVDAAVARMLAHGDVTLAYGWRVIRPIFIQR